MSRVYVVVWQIYLLRVAWLGCAFHEIVRPVQIQGGVVGGLCWVLDLLCLWRLLNWFVLD